MNFFTRFFTIFFPCKGWGAIAANQTSTSTLLKLYKRSNHVAVKHHEHSKKTQVLWVKNPEKPAKIYFLLISKLLKLLLLQSQQHHVSLSKRIYNFCLIFTVIINIIDFLHVATVLSCRCTSISKDSLLFQYWWIGVILVISHQFEKLAKILKPS